MTHERFAHCCRMLLLICLHHLRSCHWLPHREHVVAVGLSAHGHLLPLLLLLVHLPFGPQVLKFRQSLQGLICLLHLSSDSRHSITAPGRRLKHHRGGSHRRVHLARGSTTPIETVSAAQWLLYSSSRHCWCIGRHHHRGLGRLTPQRSVRLLQFGLVGSHAVVVRHLLMVGLSRKGRVPCHHHHAWMVVLMLLT